MRTTRTVVTAAILFCGAVLVSGGCRCKARDSRLERQAGNNAPGTPAAPGQRRICEDPLNDVFFISPVTLPLPGARPSPPANPAGSDPNLIGFAAGKANSLLKTSDGGRTWRRVLPRQTDGPEFFSILFSSPTEGWAVSASLLLHTRDGGETWQAAKVLPGNFYYFGPHCATASGYYQMQPATCSATIWRSRDGGRAWTALPSTLPHNYYETVFFLDNEHGWLAANYGHFALTQDGGQTWKETEIADGGHLAQIQFVDANTGWIRPIRSHNGGIWSTRDGGATWRKQDAGIRSYWTIEDTQFLDAKTGFILVGAGSDGSPVLKTTDGGEHWTQLTVWPAGVTSFCFISPDKGWGVGPDGMLQSWPAQ
jgi:photosystem II stability/assembly factor-like uncharacterized protein